VQNDSTFEINHSPGSGANFCERVTVPATVRVARYTRYVFLVPVGPRKVDEKGGRFREIGLSNCSLCLAALFRFACVETVFK
jgi:hypothetical protein